MPSPQRFSAKCPPRKPLHERSESHVNERASPTLRIIGDPHAHIYASSPFPTLPAHILSPKSTEASSQGLVFEDEDEDVSDEDGSKLRPGQEAFATSTSDTSKGKGKGKGIAAIENENASRFRFPPVEPTLHPSSLYPSTASQQSSLFRAPDFYVNVHSSAPMMRGMHGNEPMSDEIIQLPSVPGRGEALGSHSHTQDFSPIPLRPSMHSKSSDTSLSSSGSTGTVVVTRSQGRLPRGSYSAFPVRPSSSRYSSAHSTPPRLASRELDEEDSPGSSGSPRSTVLSTSDPGRTSSINVARMQAAVQSGVYLQYPVLRPPTASGSWAESTSSKLTRPPRAASRDVDRWNPHLSTVLSEDADDRNSGTMWHEESMSGSGRSSFPSNSFSDRSDVPLSPRRSHVRRSRDFSGSTIRVVKENNENLTALPPIPGSRDSAIYSAVSRNSFRRSRRNTLQTRPSSRGSFLRDGIPAWARTYYARHGTSVDLGSRPQTSASVSNENPFTGISRPRNRPHHLNTHSQNRIVGDDNVIAHVQGQPQRRVPQVWSPHLWQDRRSLGKRQSIFKAPSIDEQAENKILSRRNVQILLFAFGFILPFAWFIASFLPLPPRPSYTLKTPERRLSRLELARDLEKALGQADGARYENARWWRNLNRCMSLLGIIVLAAIIVLAVLASRMRN